MPEEERLLLDLGQAKTHAENGSLLLYGLLLLWTLQLRKQTLMNQAFPVSCSLKSLLTPVNKKAPLQMLIKSNCRP